MGDGQVVVKTDVDRLIGLVEQKKEISVPDAAKQLGVPTQTIESLADLLEEEGVVHIKYKFTTPYLIYSKGAGKGAGGPAKSEIQETEEGPPTEAPMPDIGGMMDIKKEFFAKAKERGVPDDKAAQLFEKYIANHSDYIKGKFFENARKLGVQEDKLDDIWEDYLKKLKGE